MPFYNPDGPGCRSGQAIIAADWSFKLDGLSGTCGAPPTLTFGRWTLKAVTFRGQNLLEQHVTFETGQQYTNIQVVVTDKRTQMDLRVTGDDGQPTREYVAHRLSARQGEMESAVAAGPDARATADRADERRRDGSRVGLRHGRRGRVAAQFRWWAGGRARCVHGGGSVSQVAGPDGALAPGEYYVIAVDDIDAEDTQDPAVLERLTSSAIRVVVTDEAPVEVPLRRFTFADVIR